jgi:hypothetical protein
MIKQGSIVNVYWEYIAWERHVEVISSPCAEGDCWTLKRKDGTEIKIQHFAKMEEDKSIEEF